MQVPLLLTQATDPTYFGVPTLSLTRQAIFLNDELGSPYLSATHVGMSPVAAQFTASIASTSSGGRSVPAVDAALAITIDGETLVSAPLPGQ